MLISTKVMVFKQGDIKQKEKSRKGLLLAKKKRHQTGMSFGRGCFHDLGKAITTSRRFELTKTDYGIA